MLSLAEENYLKSIYHLSERGETEVSTNSIAEDLDTKPASVSDMIRRLAEKDLITYKKYQGVKISSTGKTQALRIIRKHRLWEVFLVDKLGFNWDEVHDVAEQLEHIRSPLLIQRLDRFLGYPKADPHGDPIPDENGEFQSKPQIPLTELSPGDSGIIVAVKDSHPLFLQYLDKIGAYLGAPIQILDKVPFDQSMEIVIDKDNKLFISREAAENILITE